MVRLFVLRYQVPADELHPELHIPPPDAIAVHRPLGYLQIQRITSLLPLNLELFPHLDLPFCPLQQNDSTPCYQLLNAKYLNEQLFHARCHFSA